MVAHEYELGVQGGDLASQVSPPPLWEPLFPAQTLHILHGFCGCWQGGWKETPSIPHSAEIPQLLSNQRVVLARWETGWVGPG